LMATRKSIEDVRDIVDRCVFRDRSFEVMPKGDGYLLQVQYWEPDVENPDRGDVLQKARKWYVSPWSTETEIVETAFLACCRSMEHVVKEHFTYRNRRVFSPHFAIGERMSACDREGYDRR
jgi:hypothetical protein